MINKDWVQFPQLRYAISQLFSGAVIMDGSSALLLNVLGPYGRLRTDDAHFERRTKSAVHQSSFPRKENKYGWITTVAVQDDNTTKLKIGFLTCNLLVTSSLRISSISTDITFQPYTIWTLYNYDFNQSLDSQSQKLSLIFQRITLAVIADGDGARIEVNTFRNL